MLHALFLRNRDEKGRFEVWSRIDMPAPEQMQQARDDFWWGHESDAAAFTAAEASGLF